jgi:multisubunit Na+/H+ antiporter MnhB subunit
MGENKKTIWHIAKQFLFEIIAAVIFIAIASLFLFDENFSKTIITGFLRPDAAFTFLVVFACLSALLVFLFLIQARKKKLKSTKRMSEFANTVVCDHKVRAMSVTQAFYEQGAAITSLKNQLADTDTRNPNILELYFNYETDLNI